MRYATIFDAETGENLGRPTAGLAMVLGQFDDNKRAIQVFEMVLTLYPQLETAQKALAEAKKELRERDI